jgi:hypothetical protein
MMIENHRHHGLLITLAGQLSRFLTFRKKNPSPVGRQRTGVEIIQCLPTFMGTPEVNISYMDFNHGGDNNG